jgi:hypothetical protein
MGLIVLPDDPDTRFAAAGQREREPARGLSISSFSKSMLAR